MKVGARYYDPKIGRWIQKDPILSGFNWWVYCENDPVNGVDPGGLLFGDGRDLQPYFGRPEDNPDYWRHSIRGDPPAGTSYYNDNGPGPQDWNFEKYPPKAGIEPPPVGFNGSPRDIVPPPFLEFWELFKYYVTVMEDLWSKISNWIENWEERVKRWF